MVVLCKQITWNLQSFVEEEITCGILHDTLSREFLSTFYLLGHDSTWGGAHFHIFYYCIELYALQQTSESWQN